MQSKLFCINMKVFFYIRTAGDSCRTSIDWDLYIFWIECSSYSLKNKKNVRLYSNERLVEAELEPNVFDFIDVCSVKLTRLLWISSCFFKDSLS